MNKLQQAVKEYTEKFGICNVFDQITVSSAFLTGAEYAAGAFAEWLCKNKWQPLTDNRWSKLEQPIYTTSELYQLWQQSL